MSQPVAYLLQSQATPTQHAQQPTNGQPSWQVQEARVRELAAEHGDADLLVISDGDRLGRDAGPDQPAGYPRLKEMIANGDVSAVYGYSSSHLAPDPSEYEALAEACRERGVPIRLCQGEEPGDGSSTGRLIASMLAAVTQMETELALIGDERPASSSAAPSRTQPSPSPEGGADRSARIADELAEMVCRMGGLDPTKLDREADFADLGLDSLFLTRLASQIRKQMGVRVKLAEILDGTPTIESLARRLEPEVAIGTAAASTTAPSDPPPADEPSNGHPPEAAQPVPGAGLDGHAAPSSADVVALIAEQLRAMNQQLDLLAAHARAAAEEPAHER